MGKYAKWMKSAEPPRALSSNDASISTVQDAEMRPTSSGSIRSAAGGADLLKNTHTTEQVGGAAAAANLDTITFNTASSFTAPPRQRSSSIESRQAPPRKQLMKAPAAKATSRSNTTIQHGSPHRATAR